VLRRVARDLERAGGRVLCFSYCVPLHEVLSPLGREPSLPGAIAPATGREALLVALETRVRSEDATMIAIDEAQQLEPGELQALRDLAEAGPSGRPLPILLVGQPGLDVKLARLVGDERERAFALRVQLLRLEISDVRAYAAYRLEQVGLRLDDVFQAEAVERIAAYAEGIPRVINQLCDVALHIASQAGFPTVPASAVDTGGRWLGLERPIPSATEGTVRRAERAMRRADAIGMIAGRRRFQAWTAGVGVLVIIGALLYAFRPESSEPPPEVPALTEPKVPRQPREPLESRTPQMGQPGQSATLGAVERPPSIARQPEAKVPPQPREPLESRTPQMGQPGQSATLGAVERPPGIARRRPPHERVASAGKGPGTEAAIAANTLAPMAPRAVSGTSRALLDAAEAGNLAEVRALLQWGTPPDARDAIGMTPLMAAVIHGHEGVAGLLLARGADVNAADDRGVTILMLAANNNRAALLQTLLSRGAHVNARTQAGWTALTYAAWKGHVDMARRLLAAGADPSATDRNGWTPLQYAAWRAAEVMRGGPPDAASSSTADDPESVAAAHLEYMDLVTLLRKVTARH